MARYIDADEFFNGFCIFAIGQDETFIKAVETVLEDTSTADVEEVKHGKWVIDKTKHIVHAGRKNSTRHISYKCSECGHKVGNNKYFNFCSRCGAKMDGGKEE